MGEDQRLADFICGNIHAEYQGNKAKIDFGGNVLLGDLRSRTALRLVREWIDLHDSELERDWELAREGKPLVEDNDIRSARYVRDYVVHLEFDDGLEGDVDLSAYLGRGPVFTPLAELSYFKRFTLEAGTLAWPNGADIAPERLYEMTANANHAVERTR